MNRLFQTRTKQVCGMLLLALLCNGCVVPGDRYNSGRISYGVDFYEPYGQDYGGWGPGYMVGPPRNGDRHFTTRHFSPSPHAYRPAPLSRPLPSLPTHSRPGRSRRH